MHGQIVVCPGVNDGAALEDTLAGILDRYPALSSVGAVPLGVSRYSNEPEMRPHTVEEAERVLDTIGEWQQLYRKALGRRLVFAADEYYLLAGRDLPSARSYDGYPQHENGIGMARAFAESFARPGSDGPGGVRHGFFASVDAAPAEGYRAERLPAVPAGRRRAPGHDPHGDLRGPGPGAARCIAPTPRRGVVRGVERLLRRQHRGGGPAHRRGRGPGAPGTCPTVLRCLLPDACLNEGRFLDGLTLADLPRCGRGRAHRGRLAAPGTRRRVLPTGCADHEPDGRRGRPTQRRQVLPGEPDRRGSRAAVVEEEQGVTRDRKELSAEWSGVPFSIMDTGGWLAAGDALEAKVSEQAERALAEADVILMVVDVTTGVTEEDLAAAKVIRRAGPPVRLVVNKVDGASRDTAAWEFVSLGLGDPYPVSSLHGRGTGDLLDEVVGLLPVPLPDEEDASRRDSGKDSARGDRDPGTPSVAIIGRPNVGKSTLFNRLLGEERAIVHDMPGTTRDAIDTVVETPDGPVRFIDTAGLRRPVQDRPRHRAARDHARAAGARAGRRGRPGHRRHHRARRIRISGWPSASASRGARPSWR